jgi:bleomycin hydrolase
MSSANPQAVLNSRATNIKDQQVFNVKIPFEGAPVTNQRSSGRCWLFASTNVFRVALMKRHNLDRFELSQAYLFFWDKLEKANYFLEQILDTADEDLDSRLVQTLLSQPVSDGGQWVSSTPEPSTSAKLTSIGYGLQLSNQVRSLSSSPLSGQLQCEIFWSHQ